jgi:hypothetical protein
MVKKFLKSVTPGFILKYYSKRKVKQFEGLTPKETFTKIYKENVWGGKNGDFHSGLGSDNESTNKYANAVNDFINKNSIASVFDMGCGDFKVGKQLTEKNSSIKYIGADIVDDLIVNNNNKYGNDNISFVCINAIEDELPVADLCLIRQVLQHLNNEQILKILGKLDKYKYVIITEHLPVWAGAVPNLDKENGPGIRLYKNSGVFLDKAPFNQQTETLLEYDEPFEIYGKVKDAVLKSYLIKK